MQHDEIKRGSFTIALNCDVSEDFLGAREGFQDRKDLFPVNRKIFR
jgi:hypothetical protein